MRLKRNLTTSIIALTLVGFNVSNLSSVHANSIKTSKESKIKRTHKNIKRTKKGSDYKVATSSSVANSSASNSSSDSADSKATNTKSSISKNEKNKTKVNKYDRWYARNASDLDDKYYADDGYNNGYSDARDVSIDATEANEVTYRYAWIISGANHGNDAVTNTNPIDYAKWRNLFQQGIKYIQTNNIQKSVKYRDGSWSLDNHFQSDYSQDFDWAAYDRT